jgi:predicted metalloprotease
MKRSDGAVCTCLLWATAGLLYAQPEPPVHIHLTGVWAEIEERNRLFENGVGQADLDRVEKNVEWARQYLGKTWKAALVMHGREYKQPGVIDGGRVAFDNIRWSCDNGTVEQFDNAAYCAENNEISYDGFFLAGLAKKIGAQNRSPGDFAAILAIAHEHGHALQHQLGITATFAFPNEQSADCFAGATARQMQSDHVLKPGDIAEAKATLTLLADPDRGGAFHPNGHGDWLQRLAAFNLGYGGGPEGCAPSLKSLPGRTK